MRVPLVTKAVCDVFNLLPASICSFLPSWTLTAPPKIWAHPVTQIAEILQFWGEGKNPHVHTHLVQNKKKKWLGNREWMLSFFQCWLFHWICLCCTPTNKCVGGKLCCRMCHKQAGCWEKVPVITFYVFSGTRNISRSTTHLFVGPGIWESLGLPSAGLSGRHRKLLHKYFGHLRWQQQNLSGFSNEQCQNHDQELRWQPWMWKLWCTEI